MKTVQFEGEAYEYDERAPKRWSVQKALALGADAVMICRPFAVAWFGGDAEGIRTYVEKLREEFTGAMYMVGARKLSDLCPDMVR